MSNEQSPWAQPDPRWQPQSYRDSVGRDPRQPFGTPPLQQGQHTPSIDDFREAPRGRPPWWLVASGIVAVIALVLVGLQFIGGEPDPVTPTPTLQPTVGGEETPGSSATGGNAIPFEGNGTGVLELLDETWDDQGVVIEYRITLDAGRESFGFYMFNNQTMEVSDPTDTTPVLVTEGEPFTGTVRFDAVRATGTLVLTSSYGRALTALPIKG